MPVKFYTQEVARRFLQLRQTIAVAESVTAGLLQQTLASAENASLFFQGGITAYNIRQKFRHFNIDVKEALQCNCVSETIALQMALSTMQHFESDWSIGITGYAVPLPHHEKDGLYACFSIVNKPGFRFTTTIQSVLMPPEKVQRFYTEHVLFNLRRILHEQNGNK